MTPRYVDPRMLALISKYQLGILVGGIALCALFWRPQVLGVALGGVLMASNFRGLCFLVGQLVDGGGAARHHKIFYGCALALKTVVAMCIIAVVLVYFRHQAVGLVVGMGTLLVAVAAAVVRTYLAGRCT